MSIQTDPSYYPEWTLGWRIRRAMEHADVSRDELAERLDVSPSTISRWGKGHGAPPKRLYLSAIAQMCHVDPDWLRDGIEPTGPTDGGLAHVSSEAHVLNGRSNTQATVHVLHPQQDERRVA